MIWLPFINLRRPPRLGRVEGLRTNGIAPGGYEDVRLPGPPWTGVPSFSSIVRIASRRRRVDRFAISTPSRNSSVARQPFLPSDWGTFLQSPPPIQPPTNG